MAEEKIINVEWLTDRYEDDIVKAYKSMALNLLSSELSVFGLDDLDKSLVLTDKLKYVNKIITKPRSNDSNFSIGATIAAFSRPTGPFIIPPDLIDYIHNQIPDKETYDRYNDAFTRREDILEKGKEFYEILLDLGYPNQAAYMLAGAAYIECGWVPQVFNIEEQRGQSTNRGTDGWTGCGEGLFGLTFWSSKKKMIERFGLQNKSLTMYAWKKGTKTVDFNNLVTGRISNVESQYKPQAEGGTGCLFQLDNEWWVKFLDSHIQNMGKGNGDDKKCADYIMYDGEPQGSRDPDDDDHKLLYACYLFKSAPGIKKAFEPMRQWAELKKKRLEVMYRAISGPNYVAKNGFVSQLLITWLLAQYVNGTPAEEVNLDDIIKF